MLEQTMNGKALTGWESGWTECRADEYSDAIVASMKLGGIDHLFFVSGTELAFLQEAVVKAERLGRPAPALLTMIHESVALNAAVGYAMLSGKPAATAVHVDVGTLHYGAALHAAWHDRCPLLITAGTGPRAFPGSMRGSRDMFIHWVQEARDQAGIVRQYTKIDHRLEHQDNPGLAISRALQVAMSEPQGPAYLSIPRETAMLPLPGTARFPTREQMGLARPAAPVPDDAKTIARWLVSAENPVLFTARIGQDPNAIAEFVQLAELLAIPVMESSPLSTRMNFPATHPLYNAGPSAADADVVLVADDLTPFTPGVNAPGPNARIAWISMDPVLSRYKTMEYRADLWLPATPAQVARTVREAAEGMLDRSALGRIAQRRERLAARSRQLRENEERLALEDGRLSHPTGRWVSYQLGKTLARDAVLVNDGLSNGDFVRTYARRDLPGTYLRTGSSAGGWGPGAALGAKLAAPERDVVLASGDGFFVFGSPTAALWAARYHKLPFLSVIFVNACYSTGTAGVHAAYPDGYAVRANTFPGGSFDPPPDFAKLAEVAGGYGENVTAASEVGPALERGLRHVRDGVPAIIAVRVPGPGAS
jgi:acetolactate synthase-1/2/3 large subunit